MNVLYGMTPGDAALPDDLDTAHRQIREQAETLRQQGRRERGGCRGCRGGDRRGDQTVGR